MSSTGRDLEGERDSVATLLRSMGFAIVTMDDFPAMAHSPAAGSQEMVQRTDVVIGIYARRYGTIDSESGRSITELEYLAARSHGLPILAFVLDERASWPEEHVSQGEDAVRMEAFRKRVMADLIVADFEDGKSLLKAVRHAAGDFLRLDRRRRILRLSLGMALLALTALAALGSSARPTFAGAGASRDVLAELIALGPPAIEVGGIVVQRADFLPTALALTRGCELAMIGTQKGTLFADREPPEFIRTNDEPRAIRALATGPASPCILVVRESSQTKRSVVECRDGETFEQRWRVETAEGDADFTHATWSQHGPYAWLGDASGRVARRSADGQLLLGSYRVESRNDEQDEWIRGIDESADGLQLLISRNMAGHFLIDAPGSKPSALGTRRLPVPDDFIYADQAVFTESGKVVTGLRMGNNPSRSRLQRLDLDTGEVVRFGNHERTWQSIWALEGEYVIAVLTSGEAEIWDTGQDPPQRVAITEPELGSEISAGERHVGGATLCEGRVLAMAIGGHVFKYTIRWKGLGGLPVHRGLRRWFL